MITKITTLFLCLLSILSSYKGYAQEYELSVKPFNISRLVVNPDIDYYSVNPDSTGKVDSAIDKALNHEFEKAIAYYNLELSVNPNNVLAIQGIGAVLSEAGEPKQALEYFNKCIEMVKDQPQFYYRRGLAYYRIN